MPYSPSQRDKILNVAGYAFVDPKEVPQLARRVTESYTRRRVFAFEDRAIDATTQAYLSTMRDIETDATTTARAMDVSDGRSANYKAWRRRVADLTTARLNRLATQSARAAYDGTVAAYLMSYYGRAWSVTMATRPDARITLNLMDTQTASEAVLREVTDTGNDLIWNLMGAEWREQYQNEMDVTIARIRRRMTTSIGSSDTVRETMNAVAEELGVPIDRRRRNIPNVRANYNRVQTLTRSYVINASNTAALQLYEQNADVVNLVEFITANDGRVCRTCQGYSGQQWPLGSPFIVRPVQDTHPMCRCSLIPIVREDIAWPAAEPERARFDEYLSTLPVAPVVADLLIGTVLEER